MSQRRIWTLWKVTSFSSECFSYISITLHFYQFSFQVDQIIPPNALARRGKSTIFGKFIKMEATRAPFAQLKSYSHRLKELICLQKCSRNNLFTQKNLFPKLINSFNKFAKCIKNIWILSHWINYRMFKVTFYYFKG